MVIGSIAALVSAALYPLIFYLFGEVAGLFIQLEGNQLMTNSKKSNATIEVNKESGMTLDRNQSAW
jgi:hypothetical protein